MKLNQFKKFNQFNEIKSMKLIDLNLNEID